MECSGIEEPLRNPAVRRGATRDMHHGEGFRCLALRLCSNYVRRRQRAQKHW